MERHRAIPYRTCPDPNGRFEDALATFKQADRFDTPQVSRWTWMIGAGWANMLMGRAEDAVPWLQKSIAITSASGRTHMLLAAAYQQLGKTEQAREAMEKGARIAARLDLSQRPAAQKEFQPGLYRGVRTDHAVDGRRRGYRRADVPRPAIILSPGPATCQPDCGKLQLHPTSCPVRQATARA